MNNIITALSEDTNPNLRNMQRDRAHKRSNQTLSAAYVHMAQNQTALETKQLLHKSLKNLYWFNQTKGKRKKRFLDETRKKELRQQSSGRKVAAPFSLGNDLTGVLHAFSLYEKRRAVELSCRHRYYSKDKLHFLFGLLLYLNKTYMQRPS